VCSTVSARFRLLFAQLPLIFACSSEGLHAGERANASAVLPKQAELVALYQGSAPWEATALAFDPTRAGDLWVTVRQPPTTLPCTEDDGRGCAALIGQVALVQNATAAAPSVRVKQDGNAWHFMRRPTSISFGDDGLLASCGESRTDNYPDEDIDYSGPTLWSSDPTIFGVKPKEGQNGTHLDMLHDSPFCMGIAHERDHVYWVFNGQLGALDRYDFHEPHVIGGEDHSDGEFHRYVQGEVLRVPEVPSHLALDATHGELYVADTGHARVMRLILGSGTPGADVPTLDPIAVHQAVDGATFDEVIPSDAIARPSGLALFRDELIVTDNESGVISAFDRDGRRLAQLATGLVGLAGVAIGPDHKLYVADMATGSAYRVEPK
jgi:hypothetical protein